jgi:hypothetical protein
MTEANYLEGTRQGNAEAGLVDSSQEPECTVRQQEDKEVFTDGRLVGAW